MDKRSFALAVQVGDDALKQDKSGLPVVYR